MKGGPVLVVVSVLIGVVGCSAPRPGLERPRRGQPSGSVTLLLVSDTAVPVQGAQAIVNGERLSLEVGEARELELPAGEHRLLLDLLLHQSGPRVFGARPAYEARLRGETSFAVAARCRLTLRATAEEPQLFDVRPLVHFRHHLECLEGDGPIPNLPPLRPLPGELTGESLERHGQATLALGEEAMGYVGLAIGVARRNNDYSQERCLEDALDLARQAQRWISERLSVTSEAEGRHELGHRGALVQEGARQLRAAQRQARDCL